MIPAQAGGVVMSNNPINLAVRFILELVGLFAMGLWGWNQGEGALRFVLALGLPVAAAVIWGVFRVPGDSSSSGKAPVPVPGVVRLLIEIIFFDFAAWCLFTVEPILGWIFAIVVLIHYAASYDRVRWLLRGARV
jgi:hypothetical protein